MLNTLLESPDGSNVWINSLRRYVLGGAVVPAQQFSPAKVAAMASNNPGRTIFSLEGPQDANSEFYSLTGVPALAIVGNGTISSVAGVVTGVGTNFLTQVMVGDSITIVGQTKTVATITSDLSLTTTANFAPVASGSAYAILTPAANDSRDRMAMLIKDNGFNRVLMNNPIPTNHLFGDNQFPLMLPETILLRQNQSLLCTLLNFSTTAAGSLSVAAQPTKWQYEAYNMRATVAKKFRDMYMRKTFIYPYWLTFDNITANAGNPAVTITALARSTQPMTNTGDKVLYLFNAYAHFVQSGGGADTQEGFTIELIDGRTGRRFQNQPFTVNTGFGTGKKPFPLPAPIVLQPRNQLRVDMTSLISGVSLDAFVSFGGVAVDTGMAGVNHDEVLDEARRIYASTQYSDVVLAGSH